MSDVTESKELFQVYPTWVARVGEDGNPPEEKAQLSLDLIPRRIVLRAGGMQPDYAEFEYINSYANVQLPNYPPIVNHVNRQFTAPPYPRGSNGGFAGFCEFAEVIMPTQDPNRKPDDDGKWEWKTANRRVFIGDIVSSSEESSSDSYTVQACVKPYMFGDVFRGVYWYHKAASKWVCVSGSDLSANPVVDGVSLPSMSDLLITDPPNFDESKAVKGWAHPEIAKNISASVYHGQNIQPWTLRELVNTICWICNPKEQFIRNPFASELTKVFEDSPPIEDVLLEGGRYLPYYLDALLHPLGYNWFVDPDSQVPAEETEERLVYEKPRIRIFRKGYGDKKEVNYQDRPLELRMSSTTEPQEWNAASDINQYSLHRDVGNSYNRIRIFGDYLRAEVTVPLYPGWLELYDTKTPDELDEEAEDFEEFRDVHRLWVANEGADYSGMRTTKYPTPDPPDFSKIFSLPDNSGDVFIRKNEHTVCVRRSMEPPLTFMSDKKVRRDLFLEVSFDTGTTWKEVQNGWSILPDQIAVYFVGKKAPIDDPEWRVAFEDNALRLRITGTISSDHRLVNDTDSQRLRPTSSRSAVIDRVAILDLHRHAKYRYWYVVDANNTNRIDWKDTPYKSVLAGSSYGAEVHDDRDEMNEYAQKLLYQAVNAEYEFECVIPGWHLDWYIGDLIGKINGRDIDLNQSTSNEDPAYCQVIGIEYILDETEGPQTILTVDRGTRYVSDVYERRKRRLNRVEVH